MIGAIVQHAAGSLQEPGKDEDGVEEDGDAASEASSPVATCPGATSSMMWRSTAPEGPVLKAQVVFAGVPCPGLSQAGWQEGMEDTTWRIGALGNSGNQYLHWGVEVLLSIVTLPTTHFLRTLK